MREITWEQCLEKSGRTPFIKIERIGPDSLEFSEGVMPPCDPTQGPRSFNFPIEPRSFKTMAEALRYWDENYLPGQRTKGWMLKEF